MRSRAKNGKRDALLPRSGGSDFIKESRKEILKFHWTEKPLKRTTLQQSERIKVRIRIVVILVLGALEECDDGIRYWCK